MIWELDYQIGTQTLTGAPVKVDHPRIRIPADPEPIQGESRSDNSIPNHRALVPQESAVDYGGGYNKENILDLRKP